MDTHSPPPEYGGENKNHREIELSSLILDGLVLFPFTFIASFIFSLLLFLFLFTSFSSLFFLSSLSFLFLSPLFCFSSFSLHPSLLYSFFPPFFFLFSRSSLLSLLPSLLSYFFPPLFFLFSRTSLLLFLFYLCYLLFSLLSFLSSFLLSISPFLSLLSSLLSSFFPLFFFLFSLSLLFYLYCLLFSLISFLPSLYFSLFTFFSRLSFLWLFCLSFLFYFFFHSLFLRPPPFLKLLCPFTYFFPILLSVIQILTLDLYFELQIVIEKSQTLLKRCLTMCRFLLLTIFIALCASFWPMDNLKTWTHKIIIWRRMSKLQNRLLRNTVVLFYLSFFSSWFLTSLQICSFLILAVGLYLVPSFSFALFLYEHLTDAERPWLKCLPNITMGSSRHWFVYDCAACMQ